MNFKAYQEVAHLTAQYPTLPEVVKTVAQNILYVGCPENSGMSTMLESAFNKMAKRKEFANPYYPALGLAGEVGEYCNKLKKVMRDKGGIIDAEFVEFAKGELGDILWYLAECCTSLDIDLEEVAETNITKLQSRKERNMIQGNGDNR
jgi:NTP pyrophosphatase (non-canonical NTP hydrolase)